MNGVASSQNTFGLPGNSYGLVDKQDQAIGLSEFNIQTSTPQLTQRDNLIMFDTRDCVGELSLLQAQLAFSLEIAGQGKISPERFKRALEPNGVVNIYSFMDVVKSMNTEGLISGFPEINNQPYISGNEIKFKLPRVLKILKSFEIINAIIPRDIIPMYVYFPGFINNCLPFILKGTGIDYLNPPINNPSSLWKSPIPETIDNFIDKNIQGISSNKLGGVFYTPLRYWRSYTGPNCMPNPHTPPPYQLWNPPQDSFSNIPWPFQPTPVQGQSVPTYTAKNGVVFSGYGLYDLDDFPSLQHLQLADGNTIEIPLRKLILKLIVSDGQYINGIAAEDLIDISIDDNFNDSGVVDNPLTDTGYGDYQRFLPGPGVAMNYQPNQWRNQKSAPIDLSCSTYDRDTGYIGPMPVPFPNFRGNVWGPYGRPGDRFQYKSLQQTVDDLYLNGDLSNLEGNEIILSSYNPSEGPYTFEIYLASLKRANNFVRFQSVESASNPNIKNSMRVEFDGGFGAVYAYVGRNTTIRGGTGPIITGGLPNTQYDGSFHKFNPDIWVTPRESIPESWIQTLSGPQKPSIVEGGSFPGWMYIWRDIFPWTGEIYVPITAGGTGPMEDYDCDQTNPKWNKSVGYSNSLNITKGSNQWSNSPVIGQSSIYCIPSSSVETFEYVSNVVWGNVLTTSLTGGGSSYQDSFSAVFNVYPRYALFYSDGLNTATIEVQSVTSKGNITVFILTGAPPFLPLIMYAFTCDYCSNPELPTTGNNATFYYDFIGTTLNFYIGGSGYVLAEDVYTINETSGGVGLTIDITSIFTYNDPNNGIFIGRIETFVIRNSGNGYVAGDVVKVFQKGSDNNAYLIIDTATLIPTNVIPEYNVFHYTDPLAVGPSSLGTNASLDINYVNGIDVCDTTCSTINANCTAPIGEYVFGIGNIVTGLANASNDPTPTPDPPKMLKCDFISQEGPEEEWTANAAKNCRPSENVRVKQVSDYISRRVSYNDLGSNNGVLISSLINYRSFFVSSTPNTDIIIRIKQAERSIYTQSLNSTVDQSLFYMPIRLNLGTTTGTLEYVEAIQGTLTSSGVYWKKDYYPPKAELADIEMSFWTYDGTPIPIERCLGFIEQISNQALLYSSSIVNSFILHGKYSTYSPNLPPFASTYAATPSNVIFSVNNNSKSLADPFDPKTTRYTQRNFGLIFKAVTYQPINPGITDIIKRMPDSMLTQTESFTDISGMYHELTPLAANIDQYSD